MKTRSLLDIELSVVGFRHEPNTGRFSHWRGNPSIELIGASWFPCDMLSNGEMEYSPKGYATPTEAAKRAIEFFK